MGRPERINTRNVAFTFTCVRCGTCCKDEGIVFFSADEIRRAADYLNIGERDFIERYLFYASGGYAHRVNEHNACAFLEKNICVINEVKPEQCKSFPYWREYVAHDGTLNNFNRKCRGIFCKK
jgi:Fe-S-cluster containining protein